MLNLVKSPIERLESAVTSAKRDLDKVRATQETAVTRAAELADLVASAFADDAQNAESLERQHFEAELRAKSLATAVERAKARHANAEQALAEAKAQAARDASAVRLRELANSLEKSKPAAAKAARQVAEVVGGIPAGIQWPPVITQSLDHWVPGAVSFFEGDFIDLAVKELRLHAELILSGERSPDLGQSFDEQAIAYGRKPMAHKAA